jgi:hypothetical protein
MRNLRAKLSARPLVFRPLVFAAAMTAVCLCGCESKQEQALDQAKKQAAQTGQAQQVVSVGKDGTTTTTLVQPPTPGQPNGAVTTAQSKPVPGQSVPPPSGPAVSAAPPPPPPAPVSVTIPAGIELAIRIDQTLSVRTSHAGDRFTGEMVQPVTASDGSAIVPKGTAVEGEVVEARRAGAFRGRPVLELKLTALTVNGTRYRVATGDLERTGQSKGKRSAGMIAGGSGLGMLIGGVTHGGVGLVVGGLVGGGAGTAAAGTTGNRNLEIPAETVVHFTLAKELTVQQAQ